MMHDKADDGDKFDRYPSRTRGEVRVVMTPEMVAAGIAVAWSAPEPPKIVEDQVRKIYLAMEAERCRQGA